jgi:hypothetical protein
MVDVNENVMAEVLFGLGAWCLAHCNIKRHPQFDPAVRAH